MFVGSIESFDQGHMNYPAPILEALEYLRGHDFTKMEDGKYDIDGQSFAKLQRYETHLPGQSRPEAHEKYVDIQYLVEGEEYVGWCPFSPDLKVAVPYNEAQDIVFYDKLVPESNLLLQSGCFVVLFPEDVHSPQMAVDDVPMLVTKVVVKIPVNKL